MNVKEVERLMESLGCKSLSKSNSGFVNGTCPLHVDTRPSFGINYTEPHHPWTCFRCGSGASVVTLVSRALDLSRKDAEAYVRKFGDITLPDMENLEAFFKRNSGKRAAEDPLDLISPFPFAKSYRGATRLELLKRFVRLEPATGRILIPFFRRGKCIGVVSNRVGKEGYKTAPQFGFSHKEFVYEKPSPTVSDSAVIVEAFDSEIMVSRAGYRCLATFGKPSDSQIAEIPVLGVKRVYLMLDSDEAGQIGTMECARKLGQKLTVFITPPFAEKVDIAKLTSEEISLAVESARLYTPDNSPKPRPRR